MTELQLDDRVYHPGVVVIREHAEVERLQGTLEELAGFNGDPGSSSPMADFNRITQIGLLEQVKAAAAAAQARITVAFEASQLAARDAAGVRREQRGRGIGDQVALARGVPASQGARHLGFASAMAEMPHRWPCSPTGGWTSGPRLSWSGRPRSCAWRTASSSMSGSAR